MELKVGTKLFAFPYVPSCLRAIVPLLIIALTGCGSSIHDEYAPGPLSDGLWADGKLANQQRIVGEDHRVGPVYAHPVSTFDDAYDAAIGQPITRLYDWLWHNTPGRAARETGDVASADHRRDGILRLVDFPTSRKGPYLPLYAIMARDEDYTVRAAAIRCLNRCRPKNYTSLYLRALGDEKELVRLQAAEALGNAPDPDAIHSLIDSMQTDASRDVRIACADALRNFKDQEVLKALVDVLGDKDFSVAWQARQSLAIITGQDFRYDQQAWLIYFSNSKIFG